MWHWFTSTMTIECILSNGWLGEYKIGMNREKSHLKCVRTSDETKWNSMRSRYLFAHSQKAKNNSDQKKKCDFRNGNFISLFDFSSSSCARLYFAEFAFCATTFFLLRFFAAFFLLCTRNRISIGKLVSASTNCWRHEGKSRTAALTHFIFLMCAWMRSSGGELFSAVFLSRSRSLSPVYLFRVCTNSKHTRTNFSFELQTKTNEKNTENSRTPTNVTANCDAPNGIFHVQFCLRNKQNVCHFFAKLTWFTYLFRIT